MGLAFFVFVGKFRLRIPHSALHLFGFDRVRTFTMRMKYRGSQPPLLQNTFTWPIVCFMVSLQIFLHACCSTQGMGSLPPFSTIWSLFYQLTNQSKNESPPHLQSVYFKPFCSIPLFSIGEADNFDSSTFLAIYKITPLPIFSRLLFY